MSNQNDDTTDESDADLLTTRRAIVASILGVGAAGAAGGRTATGPDNAVAGGGSMADPNAQFHVDIYEGTLAERPSPGVKGRYWRVKDPGTQEHNVVYEDTGSAWQKFNMGVGSFSAEEIVNIADTVVDRDEDDLDTVFNNLSAGDVVYFGAGTHRHSEWLDIDGIDNVELYGAGKQNTIFKPEDGADIGGIRVGDTTETENVVIRGIGFDGNEQTMTDSVKRLHGFFFKNATDCVLRDFHATRTHPYHEHNSGGSGVTTGPNSEGITITLGVVDDIGDRCIQLAGTDHKVAFNTLKNGFDRGVSLNMDDSTGTFYGVDNAVVMGNVIKDLVEGSGIKAKKGSSNGNIVRGNIILGQFRGAIGIDTSGCKRNTIAGNFAYHTDSDIRKPGIISPQKGFVNNNFLVEAASGDARWENMIEIRDGRTVIQSNRLECNGLAGIVRQDGNIADISHNYIFDFGGPAVDIGGSNNFSVHGNTVRTNLSPSAVFNSDSGGDLQTWTNNTVLTVGASSPTIWSLGTDPDQIVGNYPPAPGYGPVLTTPDGSAEYMISVDNSGNLQTTQQ